MFLERPDYSNRVRRTDVNVGDKDVVSEEIIHRKTYAEGRTGTSLKSDSHRQSRIVTLAELGRVDLLNYREVIEFGRY